MMRITNVGILKLHFHPIAFQKVYGSVWVGTGRKLNIINIAWFIACLVHYFEIKTTNSHIIGF